MPFVECGDCIPPLLRSMKRGRHSRGIQRILELAEDWNAHIQAAQGIAADSDVRPLAALTERERELVRLRAGGKSLKVIATERDRTLSAIKKSFSKIYAKLGVPDWKTATDALPPRI